MMVNLKWVRGLRLVFAAGMCAAMLLGCGTVPATGQRAFIIISPAQELRLGEEGAPQMLEQAGGPIPSERVDAYIKTLGAKIASVAEPPPGDIESWGWEFNTLDSSVVNAFALPGGKVFITRELMSKFKSEAEVVAVLGHEAGHVTGRHSAQQISQALAIQFAAAAVTMAGELKDSDVLKYMGVGVQVGGSLYSLSFSRSHESQADELGLRYMTRLGYNPVALLRVLEVLKAESGGAAPPEWLSTHPAPDTRLRRVEELIRERYPNFEDPNAFKWGYQEYETNVLEPLKTLPPPKHQGG